MWAVAESDGSISTVYDSTPAMTEETMKQLYGDLQFIWTDESISPEQFWVNEGVIEAQLEITAVWDATEVVADGISEITLSGLPIPCTVFIDNQPVVIEDGSLVFSADVVAEYRLYINEIAYLYKEWVIYAN